MLQFSVEWNGDWILHPFCKENYFLLLLNLQRSLHLLCVLAATTFNNTCKESNFSIKRISNSILKDFWEYILPIHCAVKYIFNIYVAYFIYMYAYHPYILHINCFSRHRVQLSAKIKYANWTCTDNIKRNVKEGREKIQFCKTRFAT